MSSYDSWEKTTLDNVSDKIGDGLHGTPVYSEEGVYYFINGRNLNGKIILDDKTKRVSEQEFQKYKKDLNSRTLFLSINGTLGNTAKYKGEKVVLGKSACYINIKKDVNKDFIYYLLKTPDFINYSNNYSTGTTIKNLGLKAIREYPFNLPPTKIQNKIANILTKLDEKIESNNLIIANLEEQAQAIFKHWFVDFELFQDKGLSDSKVGRIPKGWGVNSLENIATFKNGLAMQKFRPENEQDSLPVLKIKELRANKTDLSSDRCSVDIPKEVLIENGDIIFSWSGSLLVEVWTGGTAGLNQHLFKVSSNKYNKWFYYYWTKFFLNQFVAIARDRATTMGHIKRSHLKDANVLIPDDETLSRMDKVMNPIVSEIINLGVQNKKLEDLRNTLLPKLMSGEIRVEETVESK